MKKSKKIIFKNILLETLAVGICLLLSSGICYLIVHKYHYLLIEKISVVIGIIGISLILVCLLKLPESLFARKIRFVLERNCVKDGYIPKATYQKKNSNNLVVLDPKNSDIAKIAKYHGIKTACEKAEILKILRECVKEMEKVYDDLALLPPGMDYFTAGIDPHFIILDEQSMI